MKIGIDARNLELSGGVEVYTCDLIDNLLKIDKDNEYIVYISNKLNPAFSSFIAKLKEQVRVRIVPSQTYHGLKKLIPLPMLIKDELDILHSPAYFISRYIRMRRPKLVTTFHGIVFEYYKIPKELRARLFWKIGARLSAWMSDRIISVSEKLKQEIIEKYRISSSKIDVTYCGVSDDFRPLSKVELEESDEILGKYHLQQNDEYIFSIGGETLVKNIPTLIKAFAILKRNYGFDGKLVIRRVKPLYNLLKKYDLSLNKDVIFITRWLPRSHLVFLYNRSVYTVFPSLYDGIGAPVIESIACGKSVIVSAFTAMSEVAGDSGLAIKNATDPNEWASAMYLLLADNKLRSKLEEKALARSVIFRWSRVAQRTLNVYRKVVK